jgi:hypothetical protein
MTFALVIEPDVYADRLTGLFNRLESRALALGKVRRSGRADVLHGWVYYVASSLVEVAYDVASRVIPEVTGRPGAPVGLVVDERRLAGVLGDAAALRQAGRRVWEGMSSSNRFQDVVEAAERFASAQAKLIECAVRFTPGGFHQEAPGDVFEVIGVWFRHNSDGAVIGASVGMVGGAVAAALLGLSSSAAMVVTVAAAVIGAIMGAVLQSIFSFRDKRGSRNKRDGRRVNTAAEGSGDSQDEARNAASGLIIIRDWPFF